MMNWPEYSVLYMGILSEITLTCKEHITYLECMYSVLDGLSSWWVWDEAFTDVIGESSEAYIQHTLSTQKGA